MKRFISIMLAILILCLSGCATNSTRTTYIQNATDAYGNHEMTSGNNHTIFPDRVPYDLTYNDKHITLENVEWYQCLANYSYCLYVVVTLDCKELDETQLHWLRESDLDVDTYLTHEKNENDFDRMSCLGSLLLKDNKKIQFVFISSIAKENRYEFENSDISVCVRATQEKCEDDDSDSHMVEELHYEKHIDKDIKSVEEIPQPLYDYIVKWLKQKTPTT